MGFITQQHCGGFRKSTANGSQSLCLGGTLVLLWMHSNNGKYSAKPTRQQHTLTLAICSFSQCILNKDMCLKQHFYAPCCKRDPFPLTQALLPHLSWTIGRLVNIYHVYPTLPPRSSGRPVTYKEGGQGQQPQAAGAGRWWQWGWSWLQLWFG